MKATIDVPDELHRRVKARSALLGRTVRDVTIELYQEWLADEPESAPKQSPEQWLDEWLELGEARLSGAPDGPTASEIVAADRDRLERR